MTWTQRAQLSFKFSRWLWKFLVFSIILNHLSKKPLFPPRDHLSSPIIVDIMRCSPAKVSHCPLAHLPLHTATGWHLQKLPICCYLTHRMATPFSALREPPSHSLSNYCLFSFPLFHLQFAAIVCSHCQSVPAQLWQLFFSLIAQQFHKTKRVSVSQREMTLSAAAAYIDQFILNSPLIQVTDEQRCFSSMLVGWW